MGKNRIMESLKLIFTITSLILLLPSMAKISENCDSEELFSFCSTYYNFVITRLFDLFLKSRRQPVRFFKVWERINQWASVLTAALSFGILCPGLNSLIAGEKILNIITILFGVAASCVAEEFIEIVFHEAYSESLQKRLLKEYGAEKRRNADYE